MEEQLLEELEKKRVEQEEEEHRKKVMFLTSCSVYFILHGVFTVTLGKEKAQCTQIVGVCNHK